MMISSFWEGVYNEAADELPNAQKVTLDVPIDATFEVTVVGDTYMTNKSVNDVLQQLEDKIEEVERQTDVDIRFDINRGRAKDSVQYQLYDA